MAITIERKLDQKARCDTLEEALAVVRQIAAEAEAVEMRATMVSMSYNRGWGKTPGYWYVIVLGDDERSGRQALTDVLGDGTHGTEDQRQ